MNSLDTAQIHYDEDDNDPNQVDFINTRGEKRQLGLVEGNKAVKDGDDAIICLCDGGRERLVSCLRGRETDLRKPEDRFIRKICAERGLKSVGKK